MKRTYLAIAVTLAAVAAEARTFEIRAWRGETVAAEVADFFTGEIAAPTGFGVKVGSVEAVKYLTAAGGRQYASCLDKVVWGKTDGAHRWVEIAVPADAKPGVYELGALRLKVLDRVLPPAKEWKYFLDLWQHPWAVSRFFGVRPFSSGHYAKMRPLWELLASAGQKALTVSLLEEPWDHQCYDAYHAMVRRVRHADGSWSFDYSLFDEYVAFGRSCGIGPDISCYTMCPWGYRVSWEDEAGRLCRAEAKPGTPFFEEYWGPFLADFKRHLEEKGWFKDAYIAMDERDPDDLRIIVSFIQKKAPGLKTAMAGNRKPSDFEGLVFDNYCQALRKATPEFLEKEVPERRAKGYRTTCYVCCGPDYPNTFMSSELAEAFWLGSYPAAVGLDGFLRWAWNSWPKDPSADASFGTWKAGDTFLVYPDGSPSSRFLALRSGIVAAEKVRILKESADFDARKFADTAAWYKREEAIANMTKFGRVRTKMQEFVNAD